MIARNLTNLFISKPRRSSFYDAGDQWMLHFDEKGGKSREIPVRHDLAKIIFGRRPDSGTPSGASGTPNCQPSPLPTPSA